LTLKKFILSLFLAFPLMSIGQSVKEDMILGQWMSPEKDLKVLCYKENNLYYAKVIWFKKYYSDIPDDPHCVPESQWLESVVMDKFQFKQDQWVNGKIWNLKNGKRYSAYIQLKGNDTLNVVGYVMFRFFNQKTFFVRVKEGQVKAGKN